MTQIHVHKRAVNMQALLELIVPVYIYIHKWRHEIILKRHALACNAVKYIIPRLLAKYPIATGRGSANNGTEVIPSHCVLTPIPASTFLKIGQLQEF